VNFIGLLRDRQCKEVDALFSQSSQLTINHGFLILTA
jgi:hypothetical protein